MNEPKPTLGRVIIGSVGAAVVLWGLEQIDPKIAMLYLIVILLSVVMVYRGTIFTQINSIIGFSFNLIKDFTV